MADRKPQGRDETIQALREAAEELFALKGPGSVTVREIAAHANVNHGLFHRHIGSKEDMLALIIDGHLQAFRGAIKSTVSVEEAVAAMMQTHRSRPSFVRIMAFLILERRDVREFTSTSGGVAALADSVAEAGVADQDARVIASLGGAFAMGWAMFGGFTRTAAGIPRSQDIEDDFVTASLISAIWPGRERVLDGIDG